MPTMLRHTLTLHGFAELDTVGCGGAWPPSVGDVPAEWLWQRARLGGVLGAGILKTGINGRRRPSRPRRLCAAPGPERRADPGTAGSAPPAGRQGLPPG